MATKIGPKTVTQRDRSKNLVFCVDAANSRSYGGEPTTNIQTGGGGSGGGDFSSGSTSGWSWDAKTDGTFDIYTADTHSGSYCARLKNSTVSSIALWRDVTLTNGVTYTFSVWVKNLNCPTTPYFSSAGTAVSTVSGGSSLTGISGNWQRFHWTFTVTGSTGSFSPYIRTNLHATQGYFLLDDMQIEQKSGPTPFTATSRTASTALKNISGVGAQGTSLEATTFETYGQSLFKPTTRNVLASFDKNQGHIGGAYWDFDGSDETINCGDIDALEIQYMTIAAWINPDATTADDYVISTKQGGGFSMGINISSMGANKISTRSYAAGAYNNLAGTSDIPIGEWTYVVTTYDGSNFRIYVNGEQENSSAVAGTLDYTAGNLFIGAESGGAVPGGGYFNGKIATAMIWSVALTAKEIKDIYIAQKGRFGK